MFAMASRNGFLIPNDSISLTDYEPQSVDMYEQMHSVNVKMAIASNHNVIKNIELIRTLYPKNNHLTILTDNTYYGLAHYAYVKKELKKDSTPMVSSRRMRSAPIGAASGAVRDSSGEIGMASVV